MATLQEVVKIITYFGALWPRHTAQWGKDTAKAWWTILEDLPYEQLQLAAKKIGSQDSPWPPSAGELRHAVMDLNMSNDERMTAGEAWNEVNMAVRSHGKHAYLPGPPPLNREPTRQWSSPQVKRAFEAIGGWSYFQQAQEDAQMADRARFCQAFEQLQKREQTDARMLPAVREYTEQVRLLANRMKMLPAGDE